MISIYTTENGLRLRYILDFMFGEVLGIPYEIVLPGNYDWSTKSFIINYSSEEFEQAHLCVWPMGLLTENNIHTQELEVSNWNDLPVFFRTIGGDIPFDIFSAAFYLLSRYEEYLPFTPDEHGRYPATESLAYRHNFLGMALIDRWVLALKAIIHSREPAIQFPDRSMNFIPTYDIDIAYSYRGKGLKRNLGGLLQDLFAGNFKAAQQRMAVLRGKQPDPYDSYAFLDQLHTKYQLSPIYFFLVGKNGPYDKNLAARNILMKQLIANTSSRYRIGIHPSYRSKDDKQRMKQEIEQLNSPLSRQHYIRFTLPETFRHLCELGITEDYSMGYGSINGFRASTSFPHQWFDLSKNESSGLRLYPFCYMECNSFYEQHMNTHQALIEILHYAAEVKYCKGTLITIWHNFSLGSDPLWEGWRHVYEKLIEHVHYERSV